MGLWSRVRGRHLDGTIVLASGKTFDPKRRRSDGVLGAEEVEYCRREGIPLGYDCLQIGLVTLACEDDLVDVPFVQSNPAAAAADVEGEVCILKSRFLGEVERLLGAAQGTAPASIQLERTLMNAADHAADGLAARFDLVSVDRGRTVLRIEAAKAMARFSGASPGVRQDDIHSRLAFRKWRLSDAGRYAHLLGNPNVWRHLPGECPVPFTADVARRLIEASWIESRHEVNAIEMDGHPIGQVLLRFDTPFAAMKTAEPAYWLGEEYWGRGWMRRILEVCTYRWFEKYSLDLLYLWIDADNHGSVRAAEHAGYRRYTTKDEAEVHRALQKTGHLRYVRYRADVL